MHPAGDFLGPEHGHAMRRSTLKYGPAILAVLALALAGAAAGADQGPWEPTRWEQSPWRLAGPFGGNARALAYDPSFPDHILLGSGGGALFESLDNGMHWRPFAQLGAGHDLMLESIAFDPSQSQTIYAAGWSITGSGGGFFVTRDGGRSWSEPEALLGKSVQALAVAQSDPQTLIAGALDGLYRSLDGGRSWTRISPAGDPDLKNFESVAIDPRDPQTIYAGTWHLPWKTTDGGLHWISIKQGVIDDSDVFSIILDHGNPQTVFASACSGIFRSDDGGQLFRKVQGMPNSARRTRVLRQDPADANTVYAGTTEGLWKTTDGGQNFKPISPPDFILNSVLVDPRNGRRVLIATDRGGVFASDDGGQSFYASNEGFSQRQITALVADPQAPSDLYVSVLNDKEFGGIFHRHEGRWTQLNEGLGTGEVFDLQRSPAGQLVAATNHGLFVLEAGSQRWEPSRALRIEAKATAGKENKSKAIKSRAIKTKPGKAKSEARKAGPGWSRKAISPPPGANVMTRSIFDGRATALALGSRRWFAATAAGLLMSHDLGGSWSGTAVDGEKDFYSVSAHGRTVAAATLRQVWTSSDEGDHWRLQPLPPWVTRIYGVAVAAGAAGEDELWVATREGALRWRRTDRASATGGPSVGPYPSHPQPDIGEWQPVLNGLPPREVISIRAEGGWLLAGASASDTVYVSRDQGQSWEAEPETGFEVTGAVKPEERLYLLTRQHGVLEQAPAASSADVRPDGE
jgi:photosystem II stability/assembly factor-like uncharacterized protein